MKKEFIKDEYRESRGSSSRILEISCSKCGEFLAYYQKDGPGPLKRMYIDRLVMNNFIVKNNDYYCKKCNKYIGRQYIYEKEKRSAIKLFVGEIKKRIVSIKSI